MKNVALLLFILVGIYTPIQSITIFAWSTEYHTNGVVKRTGPSVSVPEPNVPNIACLCALACLVQSMRSANAEGNSSESYMSWLLATGMFLGGTAAYEGIKYSMQIIEKTN